MSDLMDDAIDAPVDTPCRQDPEAWFPPPGGSAPIARALCQTCPAIAPCLEAALTFERDTKRASRFGIWGGLTPTERADEAAIRAAEQRLGVAA